MDYNPFSLNGKNILVTGASSGIGRSIAVECSKMGATVIITGRDEERLVQTKELLHPNNHSIITADLNIEESITCLVSQITQPLDGLVNCAGVNNLLPFQFINREKMEEVFNPNFFGPVLLTQKMLKKKLLAKGASIVFISSISGVYCSAVASSMYSSSKGAINGLVKGMALDMAPKNIRVNSINPGVVKTNIFSDGDLTEEQLAEEAKKYPLKRFGEPQDVANAAIYLLSGASSWVTGSNLVIDGGFTLL